jgi:hypothetical protein
MYDTYKAAQFLSKKQIMLEYMRNTLPRAHFLSYKILAKIQRLQYFRM